MTEKYLRSLIREMIRGEFNKAVPGQKGKRFIPDIIKVSKEEVNKLNDDRNSPHIRFIKQGEDSIMLISALLKVALDQSQRGRTSRETLMDQAPLLRKFNEIFEGNSMFKVILKQSLTGSKIRSTPSGEFYASKLYVLDNPDDPETIYIANPVKYGMMAGINEDKE
jgi:hypothetical protein